MHKRLWSIVILLALALLPGSYQFGGVNANIWTQLPSPEVTTWPPTSRNAGNAAPLPQNNIELKAVGILSANSAWAVGRTTMTPSSQAVAAHWNGTRWDKIDILGWHPGEQDLKDVVALAEDDVWAVGQYSEGPNLSRALITHWDGKEWTIFPVPGAHLDYNTLEAIAAVKADDIWAVGLSVSEGRSPRSQPLILHWDGQRWSRVPGPAHSDDVNGLNDVSIVSSQDIWAIGFHSVAHWDGRAWTEVYRNTENRDRGAFTGIAALSPNDVWVVGSWSRPGGCDHSRIEMIHWDGVAWNEPPLPTLSYSCFGSPSLWHIAATSANDVWTIGGWQSQGLLMRWDGKTWGVHHPCRVYSQFDNYSSKGNSDRLLFDDIAAGPGGEVYVLQYTRKATDDYYSNRDYILAPPIRALCPIQPPTSTPTPLTRPTRIPPQTVKARPTRELPTPVGTKILPPPGFTRSVPLPVPTR